MSLAGITGLTRDRWGIGLLLGAVVLFSGADAATRADAGLDSRVVAERASDVLQRLDDLDGEVLRDALELLERTGSSGARSTGARSSEAPDTASLKEALRAAPRSDLVDALYEFASLSDRRGLEHAAIELVGAVGGHAELNLIATLARLAASSDTESDSLREALEQSLLRILARSPRALDSVVETLRALPARHAESLIESVGVLGSADALDALTRCLGERPESDPRLLGEVARLGRAVAKPLDGSLRARVRPFVEHREILTSALAISALGALEDYESIPRLIELLEEDHPVIRVRADEALTAITSKNFHESPEAWRHWYARELEWRQTESRTCFAALLDRDPAVAFQSIHEVAKRRLFRHELANELVAALSRPEPELVLLVCAKLSNLGSRRAVSALIDTLSVPDREIAAAAGDALRVITGRDLPDDPRLWRLYEQ